VQVAWLHLDQVQLGPFRARQLFQVVRFYAVALAKQESLALWRRQVVRQHRPNGRL
jgi:hypothetical protein